jgi:hypothetical protein
MESPSFRTALRDFGGLDRRVVCMLVSLRMALREYAALVQRIAHSAWSMTPEAELTRDSQCNVNM